MVAPHFFCVFYYSMKVKSMKNFQILSLILVSVFMLAGCGPNDAPSEDLATPQINTIPENAYPSNGNQTSGENGYPSSLRIQPTIEGLLTEPPNPEIDLPEAEANTGVVGGVLIREILDEGFVPFQPRELILGKVIYDEENSPAFIRYNEISLRAELFPTGIFLFTDVPPGTYGLIVDAIAFQFPVVDDQGNELFLEVKPGEALNLGQLIVSTPDQ